MLADEVVEHVRQAHIGIAELGTIVYHDGTERIPGDTGIKMTLFRVHRELLDGPRGNTGAKLNSGAGT